MNEQQEQAIEAVLAAKDAEIERLTAERDQWKAMQRQTAANYVAQEAELEAADARLIALQEENERLKEQRDDLGPFFVRDMARLLKLSDTASMDDIRNALTALRDQVARVEQALRTMARVAGQAAVEQLDPMLASADARFADYCTTWADLLAALTQRETT